MARKHRYQTTHPQLWNAVEGAVRDARNQHPDIVITDKRLGSITKRVVGAVLSLAQGERTKQEEEV